MPMAMLDWIFSFVDRGWTLSVKHIAGVLPIGVPRTCGTLWRSVGCQRARHVNDLPFDLLERSNFCVELEM